MATINVRDINAGNDAAPFEIYTPDFETGAKIGDTYTAAQLREGIDLTVSDNANSIEIVSRGLRCGNNQFVTFTIPREQVINYGNPVTNPDTYVVITGPTERPLGESATLTANASNHENPSGPFTYLWSTGATTQTITVTETSAVTRNYTCTVTAPNGTSGNDDHSVEWSDIGEGIVDLETDGPIFENQNDASLAAISPAANEGRFGITWRDSTSSERITVKIIEASPGGGSEGFEITVNEAASINRNSYTYTVGGNPPPGTYHLTIEFTVSANVGNPDVETITQTIIVPEEGNGFEESICGRDQSYTFFLSAPRIEIQDFCNGGTWGVTNSVSVPTQNISALEQLVCDDGVGLNGNGNYYIVKNISNSSTNAHNEVYWKIRNNGTVEGVGIIQCNSGTNGGGTNGLQQKPEGGVEF